MTDAQCIALVAAKLLDGKYVHAKAVEEATKNAGYILHCSGEVADAMTLVKARETIRATDPSGT